MNFTNFKDAKPELGMITWRASRDGIPLLFNAEMRWRGAGLSQVISPQFDDWDGYQVRVRYDVEWSDELVEMDERHGEIKPLVSVATCPFCHQVPRVYFYAPVGWPPMNADNFHMECCSFTAGSRRRMRKLDDLINSWNTKLGAARVTPEVTESA